MKLRVFNLIIYVGSIFLNYIVSQDIYFTSNPRFADQYYFITNDSLDADYTIYITENPYLADISVSVNNSCNVNLLDDFIYIADNNRYSKQIYFTNHLNKADLKIFYKHNLPYPDVTICLSKDIKKSNYYDYIGVGTVHFKIKNKI